MLVDYSTFFDTVRHEFLAEDLASHEVPPVLVKAVMSMYENAGFRVRMKGAF